MTAPTLTETVIIIIGFVVVAVYMLIVHRVIKSSEDHPDHRH